MGYSRMKFHEALRTGFYELQTARDVYRASVKAMNRRLIERFIRVQLILLAPICPQYCDHIWRNLWMKHVSVRSVYTQRRFITDYPVNKRRESRLLSWQLDGHREAQW